ncbi:Crp/Fnr family transcriptional regulator [Afifella pfennigii]|uniref:Crp/Fnr family transcriptional regulator n=1 Tax=Afifella pfennigii TaxID=209897 RepID=UPI00047DFA50|nr:Crp/Fnr family transcriptional regulator [Afifella pfennigii]
MTPDHVAIARQSLLLSTVPEEARETLIAGARICEFARGATIFLQGEHAAAIYIVAEGWVKLFRIAPQGSEVIVGVFTKASSFGEAVAFRNDVYPVCAEAASDCTLMRIEASAFFRLIFDKPEIAIAILSATFAHLHQLVAQIEQLKAQTGAQRVAEFLLQLCDGEAGSCTVMLPYDKALIAGRLGLQPESLSRAFVKLRKHGVTIRQNHASIADIDALRHYALEDPALAWNRAP